MYSRSESGKVEGVLCEEIIIAHLPELVYVCDLRLIWLIDARYRREPAFRSFQL